MANSRRSPPPGEWPDLAGLVADRLRGVVRAGDRLLVGLSGGIDSVALLDILARIARRRRIRLCALHVNHQLSPNAPDWERFCRRICRERTIPFRSVRVRVGRAGNVEAAARAARYAALFAQPADCVALAHHQDDQAETVLLQLLRGAGVKGLAAMPEVRDSSPVTRHPSPAILRPLLDVPRSDIERYAQRRGLAWIEDESNRDTRLARNFIRHELFPVLARRFPSYGKTLARSARNLAEAATLLDQLAESDAGAAFRDGGLAVSALRALAPARARNVLRWFLGRQGIAMPGSRRLGEVLRQALAAKRDAQVQIGLGEAAVRRFDGRLYLVPAVKPLRPDFSKRWRGERELVLSELDGALTMTPFRGRGISRARLEPGPVTIRIRRGAERMRPDCRRPRRSLKNLLQESGIPPWRRDRMPLLFCGDELVWAPAIGVACEYQARGSEPGLVPGWDTR
jgi:tRNA(Ile)-lysidine synthase